MAVDSKASFIARVKELNIPDRFRTALEDKHIDTYARFAFISAYQPNSGDEKPFLQALNSILGEEVDTAELPAFRRLFYEAHTLSIQDLRTRLDKTDEDKPRKLAMPERMERLQRLKAALPGLVIDSQMEPSHSLVDLLVSMAEDQGLTYIELSRCTSRESELNHLKKEPYLDFGFDGTLKLTKKNKDVRADLSSDLQVRNAMQRRALAMQLAGVATYATIEKFIVRLFNLLTKKPVEGFLGICVQQIIQADRELWHLVCNHTRGQALTSGNPKPVDEAVERFQNHAEVTYYLLPLAKQKPVLQGPTNPLKRPPAKEAPNPRDFKVSKKVSLPDNCVAANDKNQPICFAFNRGVCKINGARCRRGLHICWLRSCHERHPHTQCPKARE